MLERIAWHLGWEFRRNALGGVYMIVRRLEWMPDQFSSKSDSKES